MNSRPPHATSGRLATPSTAPATKPDSWPWDRIFPLLPPHLQARLLNNPSGAGEIPELCDLPKGFVGRWLACDVSALPPVSFSPLSASVVACCPAERHALGLWAAQPELLLVDAEAGPTQWGLARQAVEANLQTNQRVLIVTSSASEADELVKQFAEHHPDLLIGRAVAPMEDLSRLPQSSASRTASVHGLGVLQAARKKVQHTVDQLQEKRASLAQAIQIFNTLPESEAELASLRLQRQTVTATLLRVDLNQLEAQHRQELAILDDQIAQQREGLVAAGARLAKVEQDLAQAKAQQGGIFGKLKAMLGHSGPNLTQLEAEAKQLQDSVATLLASVKLLEDSRLNVLQCQATERAEQQAHYDAELAQQQQRLAQFDEQIDRLQASVQERQDQLRQLLGTFYELTPEALHQAQANTEAELQFSLDWQRQLHEARPELLAALLSLPQLVVGPFAALASDPLLQGTRSFQAVVVLGADLRDEHELNTIAQRGERHLWLGDLNAAHRLLTPAKPYLNGNGKPHAEPSGLARGICFRELWRHVCRDSWQRTDTGWVVQLVQPLPTSHQDWLAEPLADRPEIELRFCRTTEGELQLAEIAFPDSMNLAEAKTVLSSELAECRLQPFGPVTWTTSDDWIEARWSAFPDDPASRQWLDLPEGVQEECFERLTMAGTSAVRFARSHGWTLELAQAWLAKHTPTGLTVSIPRSIPLVNALPLERPRLAVAGVRA